jgi:hypothetical protein
MYYFLPPEFFRENNSQLEETKIINANSFDNATIEEKLQAIKTVNKVVNSMQDAEKSVKNTQLINKDLEKLIIKKSGRKIITNLKPYCYDFIKITKFFYSTKSHKEIFEPMGAEWEYEYFEALKENNIKKARWLNLRWGCSFILAMWQKSPIGDLIEFIMKVAK